MKARYLVPITVFIIMAAFLYAGLSRDPRHVPSPLIGKPVPAFRLPSLREPGTMLTEESLKGNVSLVNIWASWCVSCRAEHALLMDLSRNTDIPIVGFNYKDKMRDALKWLKDWGDPYSQIVFDPDGKAALDWGVYGTPETFVVDKQGIIRHKHVGPIDAQVLGSDLMPLIKQLQSS